MYPINVITAELIDRAQILCGISHVPREELTSNKIRFLLNFENQRIFFFLNPRTFLFLFYNVYKEKMFTIEIEDGAKRPVSLVQYKNRL